jgi:hypothetical protein
LPGIALALSLSLSRALFATIVFERRLLPTTIQREKSNTA